MTFQARCEPYRDMAQLQRRMHRLLQQEPMRREESEARFGLLPAHGFLLQQTVHAALKLRHIAVRFTSGLKRHGLVFSSKASEWFRNCFAQGDILPLDSPRHTEEA